MGMPRKSRDDSRQPGRSDSGNLEQVAKKIRINTKSDPGGAGDAAGDAAGAKQRTRSKRATKTATATNTAAENSDLKIPLAVDFIPGPFHVICARGRIARNHAGNENFRALIRENLDKYSSAKSKTEKSQIVSSIVDRVRKLNVSSIGFVKENGGRWYEVGDHLAREKVGQSFRDVLHLQYKSSTKAKKMKRKESQVKYDDEIEEFVLQNEECLAIIDRLKNISISSLDEASLQNAFNQGNVDLLQVLKGSQGPEFLKSDKKSDEKEEDKDSKRSNDISSSGNKAETIASDLATSSSSSRKSTIVTTEKDVGISQMPEDQKKSSRVSKSKERATVPASSVDTITGAGLGEELSTAKPAPPSAADVQTTMSSPATKRVPQQETVKQQPPFLPSLSTRTETASAAVPSLSSRTNPLELRSVGPLARNTSATINSTTRDDNQQLRHLWLWWDKHGQPPREVQDQDSNVQLSPSVPFPGFPTARSTSISPTPLRHDFQPPVWQPQGLKNQQGQSQKLATKRPQQTSPDNNDSDKKRKYDEESRPPKKK